MTREAAHRAWDSRKTGIPIRRTTPAKSSPDTHNPLDNDPVAWPLKLAIRLAVLDGIDTPVPHVLDAYAGEGRIWRAVQAVADRELRITGVDIRPIRGVIKADNRKALKVLNLNDVDVIDLDAYGIPAEQARIIASRNWFGPLVWTAITVSKGILPRALTNAEGLPAEWTEQTAIAHMEHFKDPLARRWTRYLTMQGWGEHRYFTPPTKFVKVYGASGHRSQPVHHERLQHWYNLLTKKGQEVRIEEHEDSMGK